MCPGDLDGFWSQTLQIELVCLLKRVLQDLLTRFGCMSASLLAERQRKPSRMPKKAGKNGALSLPYLAWAFGATRVKLVGEFISRFEPDIASMAVEGLLVKGCFGG